MSIIIERKIAELQEIVSNGYYDSGLTEKEAFDWACGIICSRFAGRYRDTGRIEIAEKLEDETERFYKESNDLNSAAEKIMEAIKKIKKDRNRIL